MGYVGVEKKDEFKWKFNNDFSFNDISKGKDTKYLDDLDWIIVSKSNFNARTKTREYKLKEGDVIKIGKIILQVILLKTNPLDGDNLTNRNKTVANANININETDVNDKYKNIFVKTKQLNHNSLNKDNNKYHFFEKSESHQKKKGKIKLCKFCLSEEEENMMDPKNPIINLCKCTGSVKYTHLECMRKWLNQKINLKHSSDHLVQEFTFKEFECEICKTKIPLKIKLNQETVFLVKIEYEAPCIIFESLNSHSKFNHSDQITVYVINCNKDSPTKITIGRANNSLVKLSDISVSRTHLEMNYKNGNFYIEDKKSKFGTLILIQNDISFYPNQLLGFQIRRHYLSIKLIKKFWRWICCEKNMLQINYDEYFDSLPHKLYLEQKKIVKEVFTENWSESSFAFCNKQNTLEEEEQFNHTNIKKHLKKESNKLVLENNLLNTNTNLNNNSNNESRMDLMSNNNKSEEDKKEGKKKFMIGIKDAIMSHNSMEEIENKKGDIFSIPKGPKGNHKNSLKKLPFVKVKKKKSK